MRRIDIERNYVKLLEKEILRQLQKYLGDKVTFDWSQSPLSDKPEIKVYINHAAITFKIDVYAGDVYIRGLSEGYRPL